MDLFLPQFRHRARWVGFAVIVGLGEGGTKYCSLVVAEVGGNRGLGGGREEGTVVDLFVPNFTTGRARRVWQSSGVSEGQETGVVLWDRLVVV
jgi:hypothetical protein